MFFGFQEARLFGLVPSCPYELAQAAQVLYKHIVKENDLLHDTNQWSSLLALVQKEARKRTIIDQLTSWIGHEITVFCGQAVSAFGILRFFNIKRENEEECIILAMKWGKNFGLMLSFESFIEGEYSLVRSQPI